ncbi:MAG: hypothetical protein JRG89_10795 [Deltaproteobacteria bacterium]|nr:hypothetical protein [Deltaproteobacteria bacterium]
MKCPIVASGLRGRQLRFMAWFAALLVCACATTRAAAEEPEPFELQGTWYVVVHYRDAGAASPEEQRWEDKIWSFEPKGSRLRWTEYPVVVFEDVRGRFEKLASGRRIKSSGAWQPSARQLSEVEKGLAVNSQWARGKSLRGNPQRGYRSGGTPNRESASVIGYSEAWEIRDLASLPVFRRTDEMSSGRSVALSGTTEYRSAAVDRGLDRITGHFSRDQLQSGTFVMIRSGPIEMAKQENLRNSLQKDGQQKWK